jgi:nucleoid-associated protein YgaU
MPGRPAIVGLGLAIAVVAAIAVVVTSLGKPTPRTEVGVVVSVESVSLTEVLGFVIRTPDGRTVQFRVGRLENGTEFPPGHLGEHQATAAPIRVTYRDEDAEHVAIRLEDAAAAGPTAAPS